MRKAFKIFIYVLGGIFVLILLAVIALQTRWGKNLVREKLVAFLSDKIKTEFRIGDLDYRIPNSIALKDVLVLDKNKDTLLSAGNLRLDINMLALIRSKISVSQLLLEDVHAHVYRSAPDSTFNFNYIIDAFVSNDTIKVKSNTDTAGTKLTFDVAKVELNNLRLRFDDTTGGNFFALRLEHLLLRPKQIEIEKSNYEVKDLIVKGLSFSMITDTSYLAVKPEDTSSNADFKISADNIDLQKISFRMENRQDSMYMKYQIGKLQTEIKKFGLLAENINVGDLVLEDADAVIVMGKQPAVKVKEVVPSDSTTSKWRINANSLAVNQLNFRMDNNSEPRLSSGVDYAHMDIRDFFFNAQNIVYGPDTITADLKHLVLNEKSGLKILELRSKVFYSQKGAELNDLYLLTPNTLLQDKIVVSYPSIASLKDNLDEMQLDIALDKSKVGINDLLYFLSKEQQKQIIAYKNQSFILTAKMKGYMDALLIDRLYLSGLKGTVVDIKGKLNGLPDSKRLNYDLTLKEVRTTYADIAPFLTDSIKQQVRIPELISVKGNLKGGIEDYYPDVFVETSDGNADVKGSLLMSPGKNKEKYDLVIQTYTLNLGKILRQPDSVLGVISLVTDVKGSGFEPKYMNTNFNLLVQQAEAMKYNYNNITLSGLIADQKARFKGFSTDPNLDFKIKGEADLKNEYPSVFADLELNNADLQALKFMQDTFRFKGNLFANFEVLNPNYPVGNFSWVDGRIKMTGMDVPLDSIVFSSNPEDSFQNIYLNASNILYANLSGHIPLSQIGNSMLSHVNRHYRLKDSVIKSENPYDMDLDGFVNYSPLLTKLVPTLKPFDTIKFHSGLDRDTFGFELFAPRLAIGENKFDSTYAHVSENKDTFSYQLGMRKYTTGNIQLWSPSLRGLIRNDSIYALANVKDTARKNQFTLGGSMTQRDDLDSNLLVVRLFKGLRFDYEIWNVNPQNKIVIAPEGLYIQNFDINKDNQTISINSKSPEPNSLLNILIKNFELANVTRMISKDTLLAEGQLNVKAEVDLADSFPKIDASASIMNLKAFEQEVGQLDVKVENKNENTYKTFVMLSEKGNNVKLYGDYSLQPVDGNNLDFKLDIQPLSLKSVEALTFGAIKNSSGSLNGNLLIKGETTKPNITGVLKTDQLKTTVKMLNAPFLMPSEKLTFEGQKILFNNFTIEDLNGKKAKINGDIQTKDFTSYLLDLQFNAKRWQPAHSLKSDNEEFYGDLVISADLDIKGSAFAPKVDGSLTIHDSTNFTYALIDKGPGFVDHEGIVKFVDSRDSSVVDTTLLVSKNTKFSASTEMNVNVNIEEYARFQVLIDPTSGDMLKVQGDAQLNTFIAPDGSVGLTGVYELDGGYYELNYSFLRRKFEIEKGSTITISGDPLDASADITAAYKATIAPYDLVENQATAEQLVYYKQRLPFEVLLKISGKVMKPEISFDIVLPEEKANSVSSDVANLVQAKLSELRLNPSEMNKQVFAVLLLGRFISDDPFSSGANSGMEYAVRQSVSKFLSEQLNSLTSGLVKGLELNVGLNSSEDYSTGTKETRTDLDVSASKRFLNDRLKVTVGSNFELEGQAAQQQKQSAIPGDLSIDYQLSKDGRYTIRAYRSNELQNIADGYVVETGLGFRASIEYNKLRDVFRNRKKYRRKMKELKKEEEQDEEDASDDDLSYNKR